MVITSIKINKSDIEDANLVTRCIYFEFIVIITSRTTNASKIVDLSPLLSFFFVSCFYRGVAKSQKELKLHLQTSTLFTYTDYSQLLSIQPFHEHQQNKIRHQTTLVYLVFHISFYIATEKFETTKSKILPLNSQCKCNQQ